MFQILDYIKYLRTGARDFLDRSQRSWESACKVWNEVPEEPDEPATEISVRPPKIVISHYPGEAISHAQGVTDEPASGSQLILWTDASGGGNRTSGAGWAAVFREGSTWVRITARGPRETNSNIIELQAIGLALDYAIQVTERKSRDEKSQLQILELYTDSQGALSNLSKVFLNSSVLDTDSIARLCYKRRKPQMIAREVSLKITKLQEAGVDIQLHWVPRNQVIGNILADKGARVARMGVGGDYRLNNAVIEFLPTGSVEEDGYNVFMDHTYRTVPYACMAEETAWTLGERAAREEKMLAAMTRQAAEEQAAEAAREMPIEAEIEEKEAIWQDGVQTMAQMWNTVTDEMVQVTGEETTEAAGQTTEVEDILYDDPLPIDPQLYLSFPEDMVGVLTGEVAAEEATYAPGEWTAPALETEGLAVWQHAMLQMNPRVLYLNNPGSCAL